MEDEDVFCITVFCFDVFSQVDTNIDMFSSKEFETLCKI